MPALQTELSAALPQLVKAVFSQPMEGAEYARVTIRPVKIGGTPLFKPRGYATTKLSISISIPAPFYALPRIRSTAAIARSC